MSRSLPGGPPASGHGHGQGRLRRIWRGNLYVDFMGQRGRSPLLPQVLAIVGTVLAFHTDQVRWYVGAYCNSDEAPVERSIANEMDQLAAGLQPALDGNNTNQAAYLESQYCRCLATLLEMIQTEEAVQAYHE